MAVKGRVISDYLCPVTVSLMPLDFAPGLAAERLFGIFALWHSPTAFH